MSAPRAERPLMTDYGVDDPAWSPLPWSWAAERLARSRNLWLVTVSDAGRPHALPVWGVWDDDDHRFAFSCAPGARKARNLAADPRVVVAPDDTVECVSVEGRARALAPGERAEVWIGRYLAKYRPLATGSRRRTPPLQPAVRGRPRAGLRRHRAGGGVQVVPGPGATVPVRTGRSRPSGGRLGLERVSLR